MAAMVRNLGTASESRLRVSEAIVFIRDPNRTQEPYGSASKPGARPILTNLISAEHGPQIGWLLDNQENELAEAILQAFDLDIP